ncbi:MAG: glycosyltransferase family 2 protein [bacterium]|nr:glycosyltransferase family 2 protein [bacterium]
MSYPEISVIIPAYNEAENIDRVVRVFVSMPECGEVIVVDDGSVDDTGTRAKKAGARVIRQENKGKGLAMHTGVLAARSPLIFFSDADLVGFTPFHVRNLVAPVVSGVASMTIGLRDRGWFLTTILPHIAPVLGGERVLKREIFEALSGDAVKDFGIETIMNAYCAKKHLSVKYIPMWGVTQIIKEQKYGLWRGFVARMHMVCQILRAEVSTFRLK